jgi:hypothetical protein
LLATASHARSPSGARVGAAVFAFIALLLLLLSAYVWSRVHPRQANYLRVPAAAPLHQGPLTVGQSFSFSFELPVEPSPT